MTDPTAFVVPVEAMGIHWSVGAAGVAILAATALNVLWRSVGGSASEPAHDEAHLAPATAETPHAAHSMHDVHSGVVDEGLGAVLGQGAPTFDPPPVAEYEDEEHTEVMSAEEVKERLEFGVHSDGSVHDAPAPPAGMEGPTEDIT